MSVADDAVAEAVGQVIDPELRKDLLQMGMLRGVGVAGGGVHVAVALPAEDWPVREELGKFKLKINQPLKKNN